MSKKMTAEVANISTKRAKDLIGYEALEDIEGANGHHVFKFGSHKFIATNLAANRPARIGLVKRYATDMLTDSWKLNTQGIGLDRKNMVHDGQHRLLAVIFADDVLHERVKLNGFNGEHFTDTYSIDRVHPDMVLVMGMDPEAADTLDIGQKRTGGDALFRTNMFASYDNNISETMSKSLHNELAVAIRLVWLRTNGKTVSSAPHFPISEMLSFLEEYPEIVDSVWTIFELDGGTDKNIRMFLSRGYAAALHYLFCYSATDPTEWQLNSVADDSNSDTALDFFNQLSGTVDVKAGSPISALTKCLTQNPDVSRDWRVFALIKAWRLFLDGVKTTKPSSVKPSTKELEERNLRIGGFDADVIPTEADTIEEEANEVLESTE